MSVPVRRLSAAALVALGAAGLSACSVPALGSTTTVTRTATVSATATVTASADPGPGYGDPTPSPADPALATGLPTDPGTPAPVPGAPVPAAPAGAAVRAKPGLRVRFGQEVLMDGSYARISGTVGFTVTGITKGVAGDLASLNLGQQAVGMTPYYIQVKVTNESAADFAYSSLDGGIVGLLPDGTKGTQVTFIRDFPRCNTGTAPRAFTRGKSYTSCHVYLANDAVRLTGAGWNGIGFSDDASKLDYYRNPVVWTS